MDSMPLRFSLNRSAGVALTAIVAVLGTGPAAASATTCATVSACIFGTNVHSALSTGFGNDAGVAGSSKAGDGVDGETSFPSSNSVGRAGVAGTDMSKSGGRNSGVFGYSGQGSGVYGTTNNGTGVVGIATSATGIGMHAVGNELALRADLRNGTGLIVADTSDTKYTSNTGIAVSVLGDGITIGTDFGTSLNIFSNPMSFGAAITSAGGDALDIDQEGPGIPLSILPHGASADAILVSGLFALDSLGNLTISGALTQNGTPMSITHTTAGRALRTYAPRETESTIEDVGEATLQNGHAAVALDPSFASTIDPRRPYYVFLTAEGENRGLYVSTKTARGFLIHETNGGASTLNVQYRIVAKAYDAGADARLPAVDTSAMPYANAYVARHNMEMQQRAARSRSAVTSVHHVTALNAIYR